LAEAAVEAAKAATNAHIILIVFLPCGSPASD
jgi:hypothetical protein